MAAHTQPVKYTNDVESIGVDILKYLVYLQIVVSSCSFDAW